LKLTWSEVEPGTTKELIATNPIVIPHGQLKAFQRQVIQRDVIKLEDIVPLGATVLFDCRCLLLAVFGFVWQQVPGKQELGMYINVGHFFFSKNKKCYVIINFGLIY
jgi:hypothetical protein